MALATARRRLPALSWVQTALLAGAVLFVAWEVVGYDGSLAERAVHDGVIYIGGPAVLGVVYRRRMGWRVDRTALRNTLLLTLFVVPFYLVGSTLPTVRAHYPMWPTSTALGAFVPHALLQFFVALAAESYFRGLLCVGVSDLGRKAAFISPVVYAFQHLGKPPVELLLSGPTDVLFGLVDYESNSILPSVVAHGAGLSLLDWLVLHEPLLAPDRVVAWLSWLPVPL